ncbi:MAG: FG-GAP repeat protein, partial [Candidatus Hydrogenedentales bacterium]
MHSITALCAVAAASLAADTDFPRFKEHVINAEAGTGLAIDAADIDADGDIDIIGVSADDVAWYENPEWTRHLIADTLKGSNVAVAPHDINGDGTPELALGADWQFNNTESGGALYLLRAGDDIREPWQVITLIEEEPTLHRIRWADVEADGKRELVVAPLKGRNSTGPNFQETPVDLFLLRPGE